MHKFSRVYRYVLDNFIDSGEDYRICNIKKIEYGSSYKDSYFLVSGVIIHENGTEIEMNLKIYWDDVHGN